MTPKEFAFRAQQIFKDCDGDAGKDGRLGHAAMDALMEDCLREGGYYEGLEIFEQLRHVYY